MYKYEVEKIVSRCGGYREKTILAGLHTMERGETWNDEHKVINVLQTMPDLDGYRRGFAVDLVTKSICG